MNDILNDVLDLQAVNDLKLNNKTIISGDGIQEALLYASSFLNNPRKMVIVVSNLFNATRLFDNLVELIDLKHVLLFATDESLYLEAIATNNELLYQRIETLNKLANLDSFILILHTASLVRLLPKPNDYYSYKIALKVDDIIEPVDLIKKLIDSGYQFQNKISQPLQYSMRGGVIDFYSINNENPVRIEFFDNKIESIRFFNLDTQRTIETVDSVTLIPATDLVHTQESLTNLINKLMNESNDEETVNTELYQLQSDTPYSLIYKYYKELNSNFGSILDYVNDASFIYSDVSSIIDAFTLMANDNPNLINYIKFNIFDAIKLTKNLNKIVRFRTSKDDVDFNLRKVEGGNGNYQQFKSIINQYILDKYKIILYLDNQNQYEAIKQNSLESNFSLAPLKGKKKADVYYEIKPLSEGFEIVDKKIAYFSSREIFGTGKKTSKFYTKYKNAQVLKDFDTLLINDFVVHEDYGIGQYLGIKTIEIDGIHRDFLNIKYAGKSSVSIPVENFKQVRKYVSRDGVVPRLSTLGTSEWSRTKEKIKSRIEELTKNLLSLYLERTKEIGFQYPKDEEFQVEFENAFPYELTVDQEKCLKEIKNDMESPLPMDRLLCGDVGFGKTEIAFRAAFKAIVNNKQVALLCPTTLLARQHYNVALERFKNFPINIKMVSRLVSEKEINKIIKETNDGKVNLLIGTHKLLNESIKFKDLGLLIIDEEQKFGVVHKEKIKNLRHNVDVLTLSATPIPRTMQSSLIGIKSLSQIETPIQNRLSVQTYVLEKNMKLVKEIISREKGRQGQVYYIHNNIDSIYQLEKQINEMLPNITTRVIHAKLDKNYIEDTMIDFINGDIDCLISTTIIENGIDIPNANTIIIDNADHFGISQLYQLKGRVGRSERLGYCYLFYSISKEINEIAMKRLTAIKEFSELGSGYRIALRDLTIRGAGDLLGKEQAGFIDSVGIDMYLSLLSEAIDEAKNGVTKKKDTYVKSFNIDGYIPESFTNDDLEKIELYKKINTTLNESELNDLNEYLNDLYGKLPKPVEMLVEKRRLELYFLENVVDDFIEDKTSYKIVLNKENSTIEGIGVEIFELVYKVSKNIKLTYNLGKIIIIFDKSEKQWLDKANKLLKKLKELFDKHKKKETN